MKRVRALKNTNLIVGNMCSQRFNMWPVPIVVTTDQQSGAFYIMAALLNFLGGDSIHRIWLKEKSFQKRNVGLA